MPTVTTGPDGEAYITFYSAQDEAAWERAAMEEFAKALVREMFSAFDPFLKEVAGIVALKVKRKIKRESRRHRTKFQRKRPRW